MFALGVAAAMLAMTSSHSIRQYVVAGESRPEQIAVNDNRRAAGSTSGRTVTIHLDIRRGVWHPARDDGPGVSVNAFAEEGKPLTVPGPLIRVPAGTIVRAFVRNTLFNSVVVYGLSARGAGTPRGDDTVQIRPGAVQEISFPAGAPGTYYYWGKSARDTSSADPLTRAPVDAQLGGAFIVDSPGSIPSERDRVLVFNLWDPSPQSGVGSAAPDGESVFWFAINGKASPNTERLSYAIGDTVRFRFVNMTLRGASDVPPGDVLQFGDARRRLARRLDRRGLAPDRQGRSRGARESVNDAAGRSADRERSDLRLRADSPGARRLFVCRQIGERNDSRAISRSHPLTFVDRSSRALESSASTARSGTVLRGPVHYCRHCPAIVPRLRSGQSHPLASPMRAHDRQRSRACHTEAAPRRPGVWSASRGRIARQYRQFCTGRAEDLGRLGA